MTKTEINIKQLTLPIIEKLGYTLYDVMYVKEGAEWFLRFFIEKPNGTIDLDDCEKVSNEISTLLDEEDPITESYNLEVSSCGVERHIREPEHFSMFKGKKIVCKTYKSISGSNEFIGELLDFDNSHITLKLDSDTVTINLADISSCKNLYNWEETENE